MLQGRGDGNEQGRGMRIDLAYAGDRLQLNIPDSIRVDQFSPAVTDNPVDFRAFERGFRQAGGEEYLGLDRLLLVINDGHRNTPTPLILGMLEKIDRSLIDKADILVAAGTHGQPAEAHYRKILGDFHDRLKPRSKYHDCRDQSSMREIGKDSFGIEVSVNNSIFDYEHIIIISSVEPHYFAGMTGGRKSILPGLADFATIERNHNQANSLDAAPLKVAGNPVAEHMAQVLEMLGTERFFAIQAVVDARKNLAGIFFGDLKTAFERAMDFSIRMYARTVDVKYDAVLCELLPPLDNNLYQIQKALENCQPAVKDGGCIVLISACEGGVGSDHFFELACGWDAQKNAPRDGQFRFGSHKLSRVNTIGRRIDVRVFSTLEAETVERVFYKAIDDVQAFLSEPKPEGYRLAAVRDAGHTVLTTHT
jgi:nickel-dependent lactate racemase